MEKRRASVGTFKGPAPGFFELAEYAADFLADPPSGLGLEREQFDRILRAALMVPRGAQLAHIEQVFEILRSVHGEIDDKAIARAIGLANRRAAANCKIVAALSPPTTHHSKKETP
jgi:hypothetical protein